MAKVPFSNPKPIKRKPSGEKKIKLAARSSKSKTDTDRKEAKVQLHEHRALVPGGFPGGTYPSYGIPGQVYTGYGWPGYGPAGQVYTGFPGQLYTGYGIPGQVYPGYGWPGYGTTVYGLPGVIPRSGFSSGSGSPGNWPG